jgi:OFA family oxalate/formate antiporter-like MFS transporter
MAAPTPPRQPGRLVRYRVLLGAVIVQLILGTVYGYSIFWEPLGVELFPPVITQAQKADRVAAGEAVSDHVVVADEAAVKRELDIQQGYLKYAFSICILSFALVMVIAGRVQDLKGPRLPAVIGAVLMGGGFIAAGLVESPVVFFLAHALLTGLITLVCLMLFHAWSSHLSPEEHVKVAYAPQAILATVVVASILLGQEYAGRLHTVDKLLMIWTTIGFLAGAGIGFAYVCPIAALMKWFPQHKGMVSGIAVAGFGFGAYLFSREFGALGFIRHFGINAFFVVHGLVCLVAVTAGALMLSNPPSAVAVVAAPDRPESTWQHTVRSPAFHMLWLMFFSGAMAGLMVIGIVKVFAGEQLVGAAALAGQQLSGLQTAELMKRGAAAVGWLAIFNAVGRIVWGFASDKIGRTPTFVIMFLSQAGTMLLLGRTDTELSIAIAAAVVGFNFGGNFALFPSATADLFGTRNVGANYGWVFTAYGIAGVVGIAAGNTAKVLTGSYSAAFTLAAALCLVSAAAAIRLHYVARGARP